MPALATALATIDSFGIFPLQTNVFCTMLAKFAALTPWYSKDHLDADPMGPSLCTRQTAIAITLSAIRHEVQRTKLPMAMDPGKPAPLARMHAAPEHCWLQRILREALGALCGVAR